MTNENLKRFLSSIVIIPPTLFCIIKGSYFFIFFLTAVFLGALYEWHSMSKNKKYYYLGFIFLIFSFFCSFKLRINLEKNFIPFLTITIICILTDIGGYIFGKFFKGPKLIKYSPNKTYSGLIGSFLLSLTIIPFIISYNILNNLQLLELFFFIIIISFVSQFGDIVISYFKRVVKIKDTGKIIPGHGGLLDRIDGMLFAFPISYLMISNDIINIFS